MTTRLLHTLLRRHWRRLGRCRPYDTRPRLCLGRPVWNGRCRKHTGRAAAIGEDL